VFTEQSIGALFIAAIIPGVLAAVQYTIVVNLYMRIFPGAASKLERAPWRERIGASKQVWPVLLVFGLVIVGIYRGWFSATEGAGVGAFATMVLAFWRGGMRMKELGESLLATAETTAMMYLIMLGAELFSAGLASSQMPTLFAQKIATLDASPTTILLAVLLAYLVLGSFMESLAMVLLTIPVFIPLVLSLDLGMSPDAVLVWFGILLLVSVEVGMISPPFGLNLFLINGLAKDVPMRETYKGVLGFCAMDVLRILLLVFFPAIALWLPGLK
ncbi:MAG: TRAP transporter large permease subunit, partial [Burkholderiales bacterium]